MISAASHATYILYRYGENAIAIYITSPRHYSFRRPVSQPRPPFEFIYAAYFRAVSPPPLAIY